MYLYFSAGCDKNSITGSDPDSFEPIEPDGIYDVTSTIIFMSCLSPRIPSWDLTARVGDTMYLMCTDSGFEPLYEPGYNGDMLCVDPDTPGKHLFTVSAAAQQNLQLKN